MSSLLVAARELIVVGAFCDISSGIVDSIDAAAVPWTRTSVRARDRTNSRFTITLAERIDTARRDLRYVTPVVEYIDPAPTVFTAPVPVKESWHPHLRTSTWHQHQ